MRVAPVRPRVDVGDDLFRALAVEEHIHLVGIDRLLGVKHLDHIVQNNAVFAQYGEGALISSVDYLADLHVDHAAQLFAVSMRGAEVFSEEDLLVAAEIDIADRLGHAPLGDHAARDLRGALNVVGRARGDVVNDYLFRRSAAEHHGDRVMQLAARDVTVVRFGTGERISRRHAAGDYAHFLDLVAAGEEFRHDGVTGFVISGDALVRLGDHAALFLRSGDDLVDAFQKVDHDDDLSARARRQNSRFVEQVFYVRARKTAGHAREYLKGYVGRERLVARMHLEDRLSALDVGKGDIDLPVESARAQQRGVEDIRAVGRRHDDYPLVLFKAVHLHEQLVERLLSFVVSAAQARASLAPDGVYFVDKDYAGHVALRLIEQVAHPRRARSDEHFHKVGTADREEGHARLARDGFGKKRLTRSGRSHEQNALGDSRAQRGELGGRFQKFDYLLQFLFFLVRAGDVVKTHLHVHVHARLELSEVHRLLVGARALTEDEEDYYADSDNADDGHDERRQRGIALRVGVTYGGERGRIHLDRLAVFADHFRFRELAVRGYIAKIVGSRGRVLIKALHGDVLLRRMLHRKDIDRSAVDVDRLHLSVTDHVDKAELAVFAALIIYLRRAARVEDEPKQQRDRDDSDHDEDYAQYFLIFCHVVIPCYVR